MSQKTLSFKASTKQGYNSEVTFPVADDFCIHVALQHEGGISVFFSSVQGKEGQRKYSGRTDEEGRYVEDFDVLVAPKYITVRTTAPVVEAYLTTKEG